MNKKKRPLHSRTFNSNSFIVQCLHGEFSKTCRPSLQRIFSSILVKQTLTICCLDIFNIGSRWSFYAFRVFFTFWLICFFFLIKHSFHIIRFVLLCFIINSNNYSRFLLFSSEQKKKKILNAAPKFFKSSTFSKASPLFSAGFIQLLISSIILIFFWIDLRPEIPAFVSSNFTTLSMSFGDSPITSKTSAKPRSGNVFLLFDTPPTCTRVGGESTFG